MLKQASQYLYKYWLACLTARPFDDVLNYGKQANEISSGSRRFGQQLKLKTSEMRAKLQKALFVLVGEDLNAQRTYCQHLASLPSVGLVRGAFCNLRAKQGCFVVPLVFGH